jgi:hypothetical protein
MVWPVVNHLVGGGEIVPVEAVTDPTFAKERLDMYAGIDCWQVIDEKQRIRGIASRMQRTRRIFPSFTVRKTKESGRATEYAKRLYAIEHSHEGWTRPAVFIQAYCTPDYSALRAVAIAFMDAVILTIRDGQEGTKSEAWDGRADWYLESTNPAMYAERDRTGFIVVPVDSLRRHNKWVVWQTFEPAGQTPPRPRQEVLF